MPAQKTFFRQRRQVKRRASPTNTIIRRSTTAGARATLRRNCPPTRMLTGCCKRVQSRTTTFSQALLTSALSLSSIESWTLTSQLSVMFHNGRSENTLVSVDTRPSTVYCSTPSSTVLYVLAHKCDHCYADKVPSAISPEPEVGRYRREERRSSPRDFSLLPYDSTVL